MKYPNLQKLVMPFPEQELEQYRQRLQDGGSAYTTRISKERNKYSPNQTYDSDLGPILIDAIQSGRGLKTHPFVTELSAEQQDQIKRKAFDLIKFKLEEELDNIYSDKYASLQKLAQHTTEKSSNSLPYRERVEAYGLNHAGKLLSGFYDDDHNIGTFGGGIDPGETPEQAAVREFLEEAGRRLYNPRLLDVPPAIYEWDPNKKKKNDRQKQFRGSKTYFVTGDVGEETDEDRGEDTGSGLLDIKYRSLQNALRNIKIRQATDPGVAKARRAAIKQLIEELRGN